MDLRSASLGHVLEVPIFIFTFNCYWEGFFNTGIQRHVPQGEIAEAGATSLLRSPCFGDLKGFSPTNFVVMMEHVFQPLVHQSNNPT